MSASEPRSFGAPQRCIVDGMNGLVLYGQGGVHQPDAEPLNDGIRMREDKTTSADVEETAKLIAGLEERVSDADKLWGEANVKEKELWRADARKFLARIFTNTGRVA